MICKNIYLIRHGQTDFNLHGIMQGSRVDTSLNATGKAQADAFYRAYKSVPFDAIYTSLLTRTFESVSSFLEEGIKHYPLAELNEIDWGNREGKKVDVTSNDYYLHIVQQWTEGKTHVKTSYGESPEDVAKRQQRVIPSILAKKEEKNILICMHGRAIRVLMCLLLHYPLQAMELFRHSNLGLYLLAYTGTMCSVTKFNDDGHMKSTFH